MSKNSDKELRRTLFASISVVDETERRLREEIAALEKRVVELEARVRDLQVDSHAPVTIDLDEIYERLSKLEEEGT